jgi:sugar/nucleoside kinase (ribokinase family)
VADSQLASRWGNITEFKGFDIITPNEREARFALANQDSGVGRLASFLQDACDYKNMILKLGERGIFCVSKNQELKSHAFAVDSFAKTVVDAVGAGDALLAYSTLSMLSTGCLVTAGIVGSIAAACECEYDGNIPIRPENVLEKIDAIEKLTKYNTAESE